MTDEQIGEIYSLVMEFAKSGSLRILAVTGAHRSPVRGAKFGMR
jgi:tripartite-type tricarboxylate transporter receptor subunit TctC